MIDKGEGHKVRAVGCVDCSVEACWGRGLWGGRRKHPRKLRVLLGGWPAAGVVSGKGVQGGGGGGFWPSAGVVSS